LDIGRGKRRFQDREEEKGNIKRIEVQERSGEKGKKVGGGGVVSLGKKNRRPGERCGWNKRERVRS